MKVTFLNGRTPKELRASYPNSMFMSEEFDRCVIGVHEESQSIIYNFFDVIYRSIEIEYPEVDSTKDEDEWEDCYYDFHDRLHYSNGLNGFEQLQDYIEGNTGYYNTKYPPYTFTENFDFINYQGKDEFMEVELETDFEVE